MSLRLTNIGCRINPRLISGRSLTKEDGLLRLVRSAARQGGAIATAMGRLLVVAVGLLILTVGVLAAESRIPQAYQNTGLRHTSKISRMTECGGEELPPRPIAESRPAPPVVVPVIAHSFSPAVILPEFTGVSRAHGLRAPPIG